MQELKGQLTVRGVVIGSIGCVIITAASAYTALKMGALPWPIVFAAVVSFFFLKVISKSTSTLNEANVTHTLMSAGAMVAGGLAFTIPGAWMLGFADEVSIFDVALVALCGVILGLVITGALRAHFIEDAHLEFPIGQAAAQTLIAGETGGKTGAKLFGAMGIAGIFSVFRDVLGLVPTMLFSAVSIPGVSFGIYNSPMLLSVGFLVGTVAVCVWFAGALIANFGIIVGAVSMGIFDLSTAQGIVSSLGMGVMMGAGIGVIVKDVLPKLGVQRSARQTEQEKPPASSHVRSHNHRVASRVRLRNHQASSCVRSHSNQASSCVRSRNNQASSCVRSHNSALISAAVLAVCAVALLICFVLGLGPVPSLIVVLLTWVATAMSAQSVGQTGIDPMEIFGLIVLLAVAALSDIPQAQLFYVAAIVAVACGLAGDVMNDFHAGHVLGTSPKAQWCAQAIGSVIGAVVAVAVLFVLLAAYGPGAFGTSASFVAAQASVVATMVSGIPSVPAFIFGLVAGLILYVVKFPAMMLGLGIYLPFYMSFTAFIGAMVRLIYETACRHVRAGLEHDTREARREAQEESGLVVASGLLGGESIVGVIVALITVCAGLGA